MESRGIIDMYDNTFDEMIQYNILSNVYQPQITKIDGHERPPMIEIPEYRAKIKKEMGSK